MSNVNGSWIWIAVTAAALPMTGACTKAEGKQPPKENVPAPAPAPAPAKVTPVADDVTDPIEAGVDFGQQDGCKKLVARDHTYQSEYVALCTEALSKVRGCYKDPAFVSALANPGDSFDNDFSSAKRVDEVCALSAHDQFCGYLERELSTTYTAAQLRLLTTLPATDCGALGAAFPGLPVANEGSE